MAGAKSNHGHVWPEGRSICESGGPHDEDTDFGGAALADEESLLADAHAEKHFVLTKIKDRCEDMFFGHTALLIINNTLLRMPLHMRAIYISWEKTKKPSFSFLIRNLSLHDRFTTEKATGYRDICINLEVGWTIASESDDELAFVPVEYFGLNGIRTHICEVRFEPLPKS